MRVKYMGTSDVRYVPAGSDFGGRLATPTPNDVVWDKHNNHVVDSEQLGLSPEALQLLLLDEEFQDVTGMEILPLSEGDKMFRGLRDEPASGTLPRGWVEVGAIPSSLNAPSEPAAQEFAQRVSGSPDPVVTGSGVTAPVTAPTSTSVPTPKSSGSDKAV